MKVLVLILFGAISIADGLLTKEKAISKVTVRLVRKDWRPKGFDPGTDEPLIGFPGNFTDLYNIFKAYKKYNYVSRPLINGTELFNDPNYNKDMPSLILTHPMSVGDSDFITYTIGVLALRNLQKHYNVFAMHSPWLSWYFQVTCMQTLAGVQTMFEPMAEAFATFMLDGISLGKLRADQLNFIGFSYSATLNGYIARVIKQHTGELVHTVFALDAFQHNYNNPHFHRLSAADAHYVHMMHASSRLGGTTERIATVDIVLNNGYLQPGCEGYFKWVGCSHRRTVSVFMFALLFSGNVVARKCDSWEEFSNCQCKDDEDHPLIVVSFPVNQEARGAHYVRTSNKLPFALGTKGAYCEAEAANSPNIFGQQ